MYSCSESLPFLRTLVTHHTLSHIITYPTPLQLTQKPEAAMMEDDDEDDEEVDEEELTSNDEEEEEEE